MPFFPFRLLPATMLALGIAAAAQEPAPVRIQPVKRPVLKGSATAAGSEQVSDAEMLKKANLSETDGGKLIEYLHQRTLTETEQGRIAEIIKRFGVDDFEERLRATEEIESYGAAAIGPLKAAERDPDAEVAYRARQALKRVETVPHTAVASAAVRAVVKLKPDGAAAALIGFLPLADDESVADLIREALVALAVGKDGKADPALVAALADPSPIRRAAAYSALIHGGNANERIRIKDAYPRVREAVLKETDVETRFVGLWALALTTREKDYVPELIALIPKLPRGRIWQLEDLLLQLAGSHPKDGRFLKSAESLANAARAWETWWKEKGSAIDFAAFAYRQRVLGYTDLLELDVYAGPGRLVSLGHDSKERWKIGGITSLIDARIAPGGHVFVAETNFQRVTERDRSGKALRTISVGGQPFNISILPDGGLIVFCRNSVFEIDKEGTQKKHYTRQPNDILAGERLPGGEIFLVTNNNQQKATGIILDANLKETQRKVMLGPTFNVQRMDVVGEDRVLVCESGGIAEYEIKTGRQSWRFACNNPNSCQRLINGNTLICEMNFRPNGRAIEVDPSGEIVWEYQGKDSLRIGRAYRR